MVELAKGLCRNGHSVKVLEFYSGGALERDLHAAGIMFHTLSKKGRWDVIPFLYRFLRYIKRERPAIVYAFLGVPCILSIFLKLVFRKTRIVWGIRAADFDLSMYDRVFRVAYKFECLLSRFADLIISNSAAGKKFAIDHGFPEHIEVIPNGIDVERFAPDDSARKDIRGAWKVNHQEVLIGFVGQVRSHKRSAHVSGRIIFGGSGKIL